MGSTCRATTSCNSSPSRTSRDRPAASATTSGENENENPSQPSPGQESVYSSQEYPIKCILDESSGKYLIAWESPLEPTWEPKHCANSAAVEAWEARKNKRYIAADRYRNTRPLRTCRQVHLNYFNSQSSVSGAAPSIASSSQKDASQSTVLSGSIFCPDQPDQGTQSSGIVSNQSQTQFSQSTTVGNHSYLNQSADTYNNTLTEIESTSISQEGAASNSSFQPRRVISAEIGETPPSHFIIEGSQQSRFNRHGNSTDPGGDTPVSCSVPSQVLSDFQTPFRHPVAGNNSTCQTIPETIYQGSIDSTQRVVLRKPPYIVEETPSLLARSHSGRGNTRSGINTPFRGTKNAVNPEKGDDRDSVDTPDQLAPSLDQHIEVSPSIMNDSTSNGNPVDTPAGVAEAPPPNPGSFLERMKRLRELDRAVVRPRQGLSESATPSSAGDIEPTAPPNVPEGASPLTIRIDKDPIGGGEDIAHEHESPVPFVAPQALHYNIDQPSTIPGLLEAVGQEDTQDLDMSSALEQNVDPLDQESVPSPDHETGIFRLGRAEFAIPLSMDSRVKDDYDITITNEIKNVRKFLDICCDPGEIGSFESDNKPLLQKMQKVVEQLNNITTHPDLNLIDQPTMTAPDVTREASWAEYSSSKFQFLGYFIDAALNHEDYAIHVVVMAKAGRTVNILKNYFLGKGLMPLPSSSNNVEGSETAFYKDQLSFEIRATDDERIIPTLKTPVLIIALDSSLDVDSSWIQELRTQAPHGLEDPVPVVRLVISNTAEHVERCLPPCSEINRLRLLVHHTVTLADNAGELQDDALGVQEDAEETVAYVVTNLFTRQWKLPFIERLEIEVPEESISGAEQEQEQEQLRSMSSSRQKRWLEGDVDDSINPSKRPKMTPLQDITHISDSMKGQPQTQDAQEVTLLQSQIPSQSNSSLIELETIRTALSETQGRLKIMEADFSTFQHRHEAKHNLLHETRKDLERALEAAKKSDARIERQKDEISKLKEERAALQKDLNDARDTIKSGGGLEADLENAREEVRKLTKENSGFQRSLQQDRSQAEYMRQQYQNASTSAAQSAMEVRQLEEQVEELEKKANGEATKLKALRLKNDEQTHLTRIEELEAIVASRNEILTRKEEEIRELRKNRPSTRATSMQPRSPKCGPSSRSSSPAPNSITSAARGSALKFRTEIS